MRAEQSTRRSRSKIWQNNALELNNNLIYVEIQHIFNTSGKITMKTRVAGVFRIAVGILVGMISAAAHGQLVFTSAPRGTEAIERAIYDPVARAMSEWLGTEVVYEYAKDWTTYSFGMRAGRYDLVFDGPHFSAWRMANIKHEPIVNLPHKLAFLVLSRADNPAITDTESLVSQKVCGMAPPQLGTLFLLSQYPNPAREPILQVIKNEKNVFENLKSGKCESAILRNSTYLRLTDAERAAYKVIYTSRPVPNMAITAGPNVTPQQRKQLIEKLTDPKTASVAKPIFDQYVKNADRFEKAEREEYKGLELLLQNLSFGWDPL